MQDAERERVEAAARVRSALSGRIVRARAKAMKPRGEMNKLERSYSQQLDLLRLAGDLQAWRYESITLRLADRCSYTPDFAVVMASGEIEFHETKGFMRDDALVKLKVAARTFPWFTFRLVRREKGAWQIEEIKA